MNQHLPCQQTVLPDTTKVFIKSDIHSKISHRLMNMYPLRADLCLETRSDKIIDLKKKERKKQNLHVNSVRINASMSPHSYFFGTETNTNEIVAEYIREKFN